MRAEGVQAGQTGAAPPLGFPVCAKLAHAVAIALDSTDSCGVKDVKLGTLWKTKGSSEAWQTTSAQIGGKPKEGKMEALE